MPHDFRIYGHLVGLDKAGFEACRAILSGYECEAKGDVLDFVHEGRFVDIDSDLEALVAVVGPNVRAVIDIINHLDWEMTRCTLANGVLSRSRIALDNALDTAYATERR